MCTIMAYFKEDASLELFKKGLNETISRGPDAQKVLRVKKGILGFQRLSIMGLSPEGMQPFQMDSMYCICNGEIYGFRKIKKELEQKGYTFKSQSDCEILLPLYKEKGCEMFKELDAEYACILYDEDKDSIIAARDPIGIRPLFYGYDKDEHIVFASEAKNIVSIVKEIIPFPPGHYYIDGKFVCYKDCSDIKEYNNDDVETACQNIHDLLIKGVEKRLDADAPVGFLLSGGLDSSLVCAISAKLLNKPIQTYAIGMDKDAIDLKYAKEVADYIGSDHHEIIITKQDVIQAIPEVIKALATYDITTIRASIGMYLICQAIHKQSDVRVLLTGEISDELFGYKYTDFAPNPEQFQKEAEKRIREIYMYDVLRADRCISSHSLEARVPFGDLDFVDYVMRIHPALKMNTYNKGKYLLRHAFEADNCLPTNILMREKAAFSDAVGHSLKDDITEYANEVYSNKQFIEGCAKYDFATPFTKESLLFRDIFEQYYPNQAKMVKDFWMPNKEWEGLENVNDPSARALSNYGDSGK